MVTLSFHLSPSNLLTPRSVGTKKWPNLQSTAIGLIRCRSKTFLSFCNHGEHKKIHFIPINIYFRLRDLLSYREHLFYSESESQISWNSTDHLFISAKISPTIRVFSVGDYEDRNKLLISSCYVLNLSQWSIVKIPAHYSWQSRWQSLQLLP